MKPEPRYARPRTTPTVAAVLVAASGVLLAALATLHGVYRPARILGWAGAGALGCAALLAAMNLAGGRLTWRRNQVTTIVWIALAIAATQTLEPLLPHPAFFPLGAAFLPVARHLDRRVAALCATAVALVFLNTPLLAALAWAQGLWVAARPGPPRRSAWRWAPRLGGQLALLSLAVATVTTLLTDPARLLAPGVAHPLVAALASAASALVLGLALGPVMERALGQLSRAALLELADLDNPLLQRIVSRAPGTWQHSRSMANLAESAAGAVGADALLVRVGAYYHDLGKADEPHFFVENSAPGTTNPHDALTPEQSAARIIAHVREGVRRGRAAGLPEEIIDFMHTHHGTSRIEYFWQRALDRSRAQGAPPPDEAAFTYPGARPHSRETGILAVVDAVEAAARTLERPRRRDVERLVRQILFTKLAAGQLDTSELSAADLRRVSESLIEALLAQAHERVRYPWQDEEATSGAPPLAADASDGHLPPAADASAPDLRLVDGAAPPPLPQGLMSRSSRRSDPPQGRRRRPTRSPARLDPPHAGTAPRQGTSACTERERPCPARRRPRSHRVGLLGAALLLASCSGSLARRGRDALDRGDLAMATDLLTRAVAHDEHDPTLWGDLARTHLRAGRPEVAAIAADEALTLAASPELRLLRAQIHMALDERDAARGLVLQAAPDLRAPSRLEEAAVLLLRLGEVDASLHAARRAVELSRGNPDSYVNLAVLAAKARRRAMAHAALAEGLARHPEDPDLLATQAALWLQEGELEKARTLYLRLLPLHEQPGVVHQALALIEFELGHLDAAERHAESAVAAIGRTHPYVRDTLETIRAARRGSRP